MTIQKYHVNLDDSNLYSAVLSLKNMKNPKDTDVRKILRKYPKQGRGFFAKAEIFKLYRKLALEGSIERNAALEKILVTKPTRSSSGISAVTVMTKPFPCPGKCLFCPEEKGMPKSYISSEPGSMRAKQSNFDPHGQVLSRLTALSETGHNTGKSEIIVLGGSFSSYEKRYRIDFTTGIYEALNEFKTNEGLQESHANEQNKLRGSMDSLVSVQKENENSPTRCVGLSFETRVDLIDRDETVFMRRLGATKIQIGVQSLDEDVLAQNRVGFKTKDITRAFSFLRGAGFKIQAHVMVNLLGSNPQKDIMTYKNLFQSPLCPDEVKIYPVAVVYNSPLYSKYARGEYTYYKQRDLLDTLSKMLCATPNYCRVNRIVRDIPKNCTVGDSPPNNLREKVEEILRDSGRNDLNIRNREIRRNKIFGEIKINVTSYFSGVFEEKFIECVDGKNKLTGFLRLSLVPDACRQISENQGFTLDELKNSAVIRELHVYGEPAQIGEYDFSKSQHRGIGKMLVRAARRISKERGYRVLSVISSVGTRNYYRGIGFKDGDMYQHMPI
ncbi:tRNA uridine(34) 5-carboxymethylaminomethyl modification radical SAM/GNAT enzyme Elp3 [candidate division WOR-3 bacterium]|nr:tRNA uridine(34) 5-carboxymethylaminomethyl modification radical SAM/GNAT enzyme Elp3 [candidate division WOR-3 bacterium]